MSRTTSAKSPSDTKAWRRLIARSRPDAGGSDELFVWCQVLQEYFTEPLDDREISPCSSCLGRGRSRCDAPPSTQTDGVRVRREVGRIPFPDGIVRVETFTRRALLTAEAVEDSRSRCLPRPPGVFDVEAAMETLCVEGQVVA